jgi:hypothetical protein
MTVKNNVRSSGPVDVACAYKQNISHVDYRLLENRREGFLQWWVSSAAALDIDPSMWMMRYLNERFEHSIEEKLWFAWLFHTYYLPTSWAFKQEFPDEELASVERFDSFVAENYSRIRHERDCKWSRGHLATMYASYHQFIGSSSQQDKFTRLCQGSLEDNFWTLWNIVIKNFFKFGRYTTFFYLQTLKATCDLPIECPSLFLDDYSGSKSHRNGLCLAAGKDDWVNQRLTAQEYEWLGGFGSDLSSEAQSRWPEFTKDFDNFSLETVLCSYKKVFRTSNGRYINYYNDRVAEQIHKAEGDGWYGIEWQVLHQCRAECSNNRLSSADSIDKEKMKRFVENGSFHYTWQNDNLIKL